MRIVVMGPPGAGKGTQCVKLAEHFEVPHVSSGDLFRHHISNKTQLGQQVQKYLDTGEYVPDEITTSMVRARLDEPDAQTGFILDGYPRTTAQVGDLDSMLSGTASGLNQVVSMQVKPESLVARLTERAKQQGRPDDDAAVVARRVEVYQEQTKPVLDLYQARGQVVEIDGDGSVDEVFERLLAAIT